MLFQIFRIGHFLLGRQEADFPNRQIPLIGPHLHRVGAGLQEKRIRFVVPPVVLLGHACLPEPDFCRAGPEVVAVFILLDGGGVLVGPVQDYAARFLKGKLPVDPDRKVQQILPLAKRGVKELHLVEAGGWDVELPGHISPFLFQQGGRIRGVGVFLVRPGERFQLPVRSGSFLRRQDDRRFPKRLVHVRKAVFVVFHPVPRSFPGGLRRCALRRSRLGRCGLRRRRNRLRKGSPCAPRNGKRKQKADGYPASLFQQLCPLISVP